MAFYRTVCYDWKKKFLKKFVTKCNLGSIIYERRERRNNLKMDFEQVYKKYYSMVYRYLLSLTKDNNMAEEIAQETFYKALKNISKYNPEMKMLT